MAVSNSAGGLALISASAMEHRLFGWLARYGLQALFGLQMLGIVGLPVPDELLLTIAGTLVREGKLPLVGTVAAAIGGCVTGITVSYFAGRWVGLATLRRVVHLPDDLLHRVEQWFERSGRWLLVFGYFVPGVRHVTAIAAGSSGLGYGQFATHAYAGAVLWSSFFLAAGYLLGDQWRHAFRAIRHHATIAVAGAAALYLAYLAVARWRAGRRPPAGPSSPGGLQSGERCGYAASSETNGSTAATSSSSSATGARSTTSTR